MAGFPEGLWTSTGIPRPLSVTQSSPSFLRTHINPGRVPIHGFVHAVVQDFPHQVVESLGVRSPDVHRRPFPHRRETLEDGDVAGGVVVPGAHGGPFSGSGSRMSSLYLFEARLVDELAPAGARADRELVPRGDQPRPTPAGLHGERFLAARHPETDHLISEPENDRPHTKPGTRKDVDLLDVAQERATVAGGQDQGFLTGGEHGSEDFVALLQPGEAPAVSVRRLLKAVQTEAQRVAAPGQRDRVEFRNASIGRRDLPPQSAGVQTQQAHDPFPVPEREHLLNRIAVPRGRGDIGDPRGERRAQRREEDERRAGAAGLEREHLVPLPKPELVQFPDLALALDPAVARDDEGRVLGEDEVLFREIDHFGGPQDLGAALLPGPRPVADFDQLLAHLRGDRPLARQELLHFRRAASSAASISSRITWISRRARR